MCLCLGEGCDKAKATENSEDRKFQRRRNNRSHQTGTVEDEWKDAGLLPP